MIQKQSSFPNRTLRHLFWLWFVCHSGIVLGQFDDVYNIPPDPIPSELTDNTQINIYDGELPNDFDLGESGVRYTNLELNLFGGRTSRSFEAYPGTTINVDGGIINHRSRANESNITIRDGLIVKDFSARDSSLTILGGSVGPFTGETLQNTGISTFRSSVQISGGSTRLNARDHSEVQVDAGYVFATAYDGSVINVDSGAGEGNLIADEGGTVNYRPDVGGWRVWARDGGTANVWSGLLPATEFSKNVAQAGGTFNVYGGRLVDFVADEGSVVNVTGGSFDRFTSDGAATTISGGAAIRGLGVSNGVTIVGGDFQQDGQPVPGLENIGDTVTVDRIGVTGTLADGTPFELPSHHHANLTLRRVELPPIESQVNTMPQTTHYGIRPGESLKLTSGMALPSNFFAAPQSTLEIDPGVQVGSGYARQATVAFNGGTNTVDDEFEFYDGTTTVSGGRFGGTMEVLGEGEIEIQDGSVGTLTSFDSSSVEIQGGSIGTLTSHENSSVEIRGGTIGRLQVFSDQVATVYGQFDASSTFGYQSGTLADGTPFLFTYADGDHGRVRLVETELPPIGAPLITASIDPIPLGVREGQTLIVDDGGALPDHFAAGRRSKVIVEEGGVVGDNFEAGGAEVTINGGNIGNDFDAFPGSRVTIAGGTIGDRFHAFPGSEIFLRGTYFYTTETGRRVPGLNKPGDSVLLLDRGVDGFFDNLTLRGKLADGSPFDFAIHVDGNGDSFHEDAVIRLIYDFPTKATCDFGGDGTCGPDDLQRIIDAERREVAYDLDGDGNVSDYDFDLWMAMAGDRSVGRPLERGDANLDGTIDAVDLNALALHWQSDADVGWAEGDFTGDGVVNANDLNILATGWSTNQLTAQVPETCNYRMLIFVWLALVGKRRRHSSLTMP